MVLIWRIDRISQEYFLSDESYITSTFNETYEIGENRSIRLVCSVDGNPLSNITWIFLKKNETVETNYMSNNSVLEISSAKCEQHGKYRVSAKNEIGTTSKTTAIAVKCKFISIIIHTSISNSCMKGRDEKKMIRHEKYLLGGIKDICLENIYALVYSFSLV